MYEEAQGLGGEEKGDEEVESLIDDASESEGF